MSLKQKTVNGLFWSFTDSFANQGVQFIIGIILARILAPREFGLIGMLTIVIAISQSFIDSGFTQALIRKKKCTDKDYSTVFFFNLIVSSIFFLILFFFSFQISIFFHEPQLENLIKVLAIGLIINAFSIIQRAILTKNINFKVQTRVSFIASFGSGLISILMAYHGYGVWSLVALTLTRFFLTSLFLWIWTVWKPLFQFSRASFREMFSFGSKLLLSGLIDTIYRNVYLLIIGKFFSAAELGYYTRADQFKAIPSQNLNSIISRVSYPVLASIQDDNEKLKAVYTKLIRSTMLITFVIMLGLASTAKPIIFVLIGEKWEPSVIYLQLLCFVGMFYPLHALNLNMLQVKGRSDLFLKLEVIKKVLAIPTIIVGIILGIKIMIIGMMINTIIAYYLNSYWSGKLIGYHFLKQLTDILPSFFLALLINTPVFLMGILISEKYLYILGCQLLAGLFLFIIICELSNFKDYLYLKDIVVKKLKEFKHDKANR